MNDVRRLVVSIDDQELCLTSGGLLRRYPVSTAIKGTGFARESHRTPTGRFRICEKIGADHPAGTIFKARVPVGCWQQGEAPDEDLVLTRILRLDGLDPENANTLERYIYIHGTNREDLVGQPAGHGCVRLRNEDMIDLFDRVRVNDLVEIVPATRRRGLLLFVAFDSALVMPDGIRTMARMRGGDVGREVALTLTRRDAGRMDAREAFLRSMDLIRPDRAWCESASERCVAGIHPAVAELVRGACGRGWLPVIIASSPAPLVRAVAGALGIGHYEAPELYFHPDGSLGRCDRGYPVTGGFDAAAVMNDWIRAFHPQRVGMISGRTSGCGLVPGLDFEVDPSQMCAPFVATSIMHSIAFDDLMNTCK